MALTVTCCRDFEDPALRQSWAELSAASSHGSIFSTYEWCRCWAETVGRGARPWILLVGDGSSATGLCPLCVARSGSTRWVTFMGSERVSGDHLDMLCAPRFGDACRAAVLDFLAAAGRDYDGVVLPDLERRSPTLNAFHAWALRRGFTQMEREPHVVPYLDLPGSFEAYLGSRSKKMRGHIRRGRRDLAGTAGGGIRIDRTPESVAGVLDGFFDLHERRWRQAGSAGNFCDAPMRRFMRRFCEAGARQGWFRAYTLTVGNEPHCILISFHWHKTACFYQIGRRPDSVIESPGLLVIAASIEQAIREGFSRYDFLQGNETYKFRWTSQWVEQTTLAIGCRLPAKASIAADRIKNRAGSVFRRCLGNEAWQQAAKAWRRLRRFSPSRANSSSRTARGHELPGT